jgi:hypothetical protein
MNSLPKWRFRALYIGLAVLAGLVLIMYGGKMLGGESERENPRHADKAVRC